MKLSIIIFLGIILISFLAYILINHIQSKEKFKTDIKHTTKKNFSLNEETFTTFTTYTPQWTPSDQMVNTTIFIPLLIDYLQQFENNDVNIPTINYFINNTNLYNNEIFSFLKNMPKGGLLNIHNRAICDINWLLSTGSTPTGIAATYNNYVCYVNTNILKQSYTYNTNETQLFQFIIPTSPLNLDTNWQPITLEYLNSIYETESNIAINYDYSTSGSYSTEKTVRDILLERLTIPTKYLDNQTTYNALSILNTRYDSLLNNNSGFYDYYYQNGIQLLKNNNIQHLDIHVDFFINSNMTSTQAITNLMITSLSIIKWCLTNNMSYQFILAMPRTLSDSDMLTSIETAFMLKTGSINNIGNYTPDQFLTVTNSISGIYIYASIVPIINNPISYYADIWVTVVPQLQKQYGNILQFFFDGSSANDNDWIQDDNVIDAFLLDSKRISNGYNIISYPVIKEIILGETLYSEGSGSNWINAWNSIPKNNICFEISPIGDQMLQYYSNIGNNYGVALLKQGIPIVLTANNPVMYGYSDLTYDYCAIAISWEIDLQYIKNLVFNSIQYSSLTGTQLTNVLNNLNTLWNNWIGSFTVSTTPLSVAIKPLIAGPINIPSKNLKYLQHINSFSTTDNSFSIKDNSADYSTYYKSYIDLKNILLSINSSINSTSSQVLNTNELVVNNDLNQMLQTFNQTNQNPKDSSNNVDVTLPFSNFFSTVINEYTNNSIFNFLDNLPKGGILSINNISLTDLNWILGVTPSANSLTSTTTPTIVSTSGITQSWSGGKFYINYNLLSAKDPYNTTYGNLFYYGPSAPSTSWIDPTTSGFVKTNIQALTDRLTFSGLPKSYNTNRQQVLQIILSRYNILFSVPSFVQQSYIQGFIALINNNILHVDITLDFDIIAVNGNFITLLNNTVNTIQALINANHTVTNYGYGNITFKCILTAFANIPVNIMQQVLELSYIIKSGPNPSYTLPIFLTNSVESSVYNKLDASGYNSNIGNYVGGFAIKNI